MIEINSQKPETPIICTNGNKSRLVCVSPTCKHNSFMCNQDSCKQCQSNHRQCQYYRVDSIIQQIIAKRTKITSQVQKTIKTMQKVYDEAIERLSQDKEMLQQQMQMFGLNQFQAKFMRMLEDGCLNEVQGKLTAKVIQGIADKNQFTATQQLVLKFWERRKKQFQRIFDKFKDMTSKKYVRFESKIVQNSDVIETFFDVPIAEYKLLYRASENSFSTYKFHQVCDGKQNTLIVARTQFGKIIGGFTNLRWNSSSNYVQDYQKKTFVFSVSLGQKFTNSNPQYGIYGNASYGPTFGGGHDFYIADNANNSTNTSYFNIGHSYNCQGKYANGTSETYRAFTGSQAGNYYAKITQWQVFQLQFI